MGSVSTPFENPSNFSATRLHVWMCVQCAVYDCRQLSAKHITSILCCSVVTRWPRAAHNSACKASVWSLSVCLSETPDYPPAAAVVQRTAVTLIKNLWPAYVSAFLSEVRHIGFFVVYPPVFATVRSAQLQTMRAGGPSAVCAYRHISLYIVYGVVRHIHSPRHQKR